MADQVKCLFGDPDIDRKIREAINTILEGKAKRVDIGTDVKVYRCGDNVVRVDYRVSHDV
jgi:hypothetical protein